MITDDALGLNRAYQIGSGANLPLIFDLFLSLRQALKLQLTILFYLDSPGFWQGCCNSVS